MRIAPIVLLAAACSTRGPAPDPAGHKADAAAHVAPPTAHAIDWDAAHAEQKVDPTALSARARSVAAASTVPVLLPRDPALTKTCRMYHGDGWYTATMEGDGYQVFVRGTRMTVANPPTGHVPEGRKAPDELEITHTEGIVTACFSRWGAAYNLEIECERGAAHTMCASDEPVRRLVDSLGMVGGGHE